MIDIKNEVVKRDLNSDVYNKYSNQPASNKFWIPRIPVKVEFFSFRRSFGKCFVLHRILFPPTRLTFMGNRD